MFLLKLNKYVLYTVHTNVVLKVDTSYIISATYFIDLFHYTVPHSKIDL